MSAECTDQAICHGEVGADASRRQASAQFSFLPHVAGLRAVAIILVVLFHLDGTAWAHGYLGVDVFLVISGYMLFRARLRQSAPYGIKDSVGFLYKRGMRIVPPMAVTILLTIALGILLMGWGDEKFLSRLGAHALLIDSNSFLSLERGNYFQQSELFVPLLHIWYLSVILQIYLLWAVGNYFIQRLPKAPMVALLLLLGLASLAYCYSFPVHEWLKGLGIIWWEQDKAPSYYQTLPRVWEILAGGLICVLPSVRKRSVAAALSLLGLLCILLFSLNSSIPGGGISWISELPATLFVVAGTILLIRYLPESGLNKLLANAPLVWLGSISFSIYLVHMPIIVYWRVWNFGQLGTSDIAGIIFISLIFGLMLYKLVEKRHFIWWHVGILWMTTMMLCKMGRDSEGFKQFMRDAMTMPSYKRWTWNTDTRLEKDLSNAINSYYGLVFWTMGQKLPPDSELKSRLMLMGDLSNYPRIILMGDSHAAHFYAGMDDVFQDEKLSGIYLASIVFPFHNYSYSKPDDPSYCTSREKEDALVYWLAAHPELHYIILSHHWTKRMQSEEMFNRLKSYLQRLKSINKKVLIIGPTPQFSEESIPTHYYKIARIRGLNLADMMPHYTVEQHLQQNKRVVRYFNMLESEGLCVYIDPFSSCDDFPSFYEDRQCMVDQDHLSAAGSSWLVKKMLPQIKHAMDHQSCTVKPDKRCSE